MPQMGPISWVSLLLALSSLMLTVVSTIYFLKDPKGFKPTSYSVPSASSWQW